MNGKMLKIRFKLIISEIEINEEYVRRKRNDGENIIEKEFNINESEDVVLYEGLKDDENIIERMEIAYELNEKEKIFKQRYGKNMTICYGCTMMINVEKESEELLLMGKEFRSYCIDCEKEGIDIMDNELNYKNDDDNMEMDNEVLQEEIDGSGSEISISGKSSNERKRKRPEKEVNNTERSNRKKKIRIEDEESSEEEVLENETEAFRKLLENLNMPVVEEQLIEKENVGDTTLEGLFIRAEKGSQELVKYWFDVGEEFRNEIRKIKGKTSKKEKIIRSDIYNRMEKNLKG
ncbi:uncharacterized protein OCT59_015428 [Rhizophagus irregularis]|uniref:Uncharacterized protein n=4 Tax=Rhizophagus irregularis TaxID=588596 RepID=A0A915ZSS2_9GLOM|nr:hypothetical protein RirG_103010 [Rhizophagus irregularis DAOM 197198w]UZO23083.1 hypothetical protein OCT59_015428 [Rhizophagus irregularis]GBC18677.2 hypothetical protein GLOIN_2v1470220 [Rhizophagus irregularis DAOM 181602=DAOM 197198]CAB5389459.1 unnamed protein product [Rhizophagus irregularis]